MDATLDLARYVVQTRYKDVPTEAIETSKKEILDTLGTAVAGSTAEGSREIVALMKELGGTQESTIIAYGGKVASPFATLANSSMAHALDFDDTHDPAVLHPGVSVVPASFAIAERIGGVSGKDFLVAVTLGVDVACRLGLATTTGLRGGWMLTSLYGYYGAAAATGKLLGLDEGKMVNAFGIAYAQMAGNVQCVPDGALTKRMQPGFAAKGGLLSALLAEKGITGAQETLQGIAGLFSVYHHGEYNADPLTTDLGKIFEGVNVSFKPYPCCRYTHSSIDATLANVREHGISAEDIEGITVIVGESAYALCEPLEIKRKPRVVVDAQFSVPYTVATAALKNRVGVRDFTEAALKDPAVLRMAEKVSPKLEPSLTSREIEGAIIEIKTKSGLYSKRVDCALGHPKRPMTMDDLSDKFRGNLSLAAKPLPEENTEKVIEMIRKMEEVDDIAQILQLLS